VVSWPDCLTELNQKIKELNGFLLAGAKAPLILFGTKSFLSYCTCQ
jgi:hypothetical protein